MSNELFKTSLVIPSFVKHYENQINDYWNEVDHIPMRDLIFEIGKKMREAQKAYFKYRDSDLLNLSKRLETTFDVLLEIWDAKQ